MLPTQLMGLTWPALEERVERSGRWSSWVTAETVLAALNGLDEVVAIVEDKSDQARADALLAALVRLGAVDGGNDQDAAQAVALLLTNGAGQLARQLGNLSGDIDAMVAGQVWLQIREFPSRRRWRAISQSILLDARRALLRDLGVDTSKRHRGFEVILVDTTAVGAVTNGSSDAVIDQDPAAVLDDEPTLLAVLQWAIGKGVVTDHDATILLELASIEVAGTVRGLNSAAEIRAVAARHGINEKTVRRRRDRVLRSLVSAREVYLRECA
jgi:hypothetical protein